MQTLTGKTALITGAGKGLGKEIALAMAAEGIDLALVSRTESDLKVVAEQAKALNQNINVYYTTADVGNYASVKSAIELLVSQTGSIDILVNNAGVLKTGNFLALEVQEWEQVIQVNLLGTYYVIHEVLPYMLRREIGDIINISSTAGQKGNPVLSAYSASKAAVISLSESLMYEVRKSNIRVMTINPSTIATEMSLSANFTDGNPDKVLQPQDLAELLIGNLKLPQRALVKEIGLWSTNP